MPWEPGEKEMGLLRDLGLTPKEAAELSLDELYERACEVYGEGDAESDAECQKDAAIAQQREGKRVLSHHTVVIANAI